MSNSKTIAGKALRRAALVVGLGALMACTPIYRNHGFMPPEEDLSAILVGVDTRDTIADIVGAPTAGGVLNSSGYYYVSSRYRTFGPFEPEEIERQVLAISFDAEGVVSNIERFGLEDGQIVVLERRVTRDNVRDTTFIRQLMGNLGRFDAGTILGGGPGSGSDL